MSSARRRRKPERPAFSYVGFRPGAGLGRVLREHARYLHVSEGSLIRHALFDYFYASALDFLFSVSAE
jgi:hypothetical protein